MPTIKNIEHINYAYPNITLRVDRNLYPEARVEITNLGILDEVIKKLALKFPTHTFTGNAVGIALEQSPETNKILVSKVTNILIHTVDGYSVGSITAFTSGVHIRGARVSGIRKRKRYIETTNAKRAVAIATKILVAPRPKEIIEAARYLLITGLCTTNGQSGSAFRVGYKTGMESLMPVFMKDFDAFISFIGKDKLEAEKLKNILALPDKWERKTGVDELYSALSRDKGYVVQLKNFKYTVSHNGEEAITYVQEQLPEVLKRGVGLLKLAEDATAITNIGYRYDENTYYIYEEEKK